MAKAKSAKPECRASVSLIRQMPRVSMVSALPP
jgi:hypothetical protein